MTRLLTRMAGLLLLIVTIAGGASPATAGRNDWTSTGGPPGLVYAVTLDPVIAGVMYAGTSTGGVFKSTDGGRSWAPSSQGLGTTGVLSLAIDPLQTSTVYAGTNRGIYRSDDGALTWTEASDGIIRDPYGYSYVYTIIIDPLQPSRLYAGTLLGVFESQDRGQQWEGRNTGLRIGMLPSVEALAMDPTNSKVLYAGAGYQGLSGTVYKTVDGGKSWVPLSTGLSQGLVSAIAVDPLDHRKVYVATRGQGLFISRNEGRTWQAAGKNTLEANVVALAVSKSPQTVYAAGARTGFYRSTDGGVTWDLVEASIGIRGPTSLTLGLQSPGAMWLTSAGGLYFSDDGGSHWTESGRGIAASQVVSVVTHPANPNLAYAGAWAGGIYRTADGGTSWQAAPLGVGIPSGLAVDPVDPGLVYASMVYITGIKFSGLYLSRDGGVSWDLVPQFKGAIVSAIATVPGRVYAGSTTGVYISDDAGATWRQSNGGLTTASQVLNLIVHPNDPSRLYLTMEAAPESLYASNDAGQTWTLLHRFEDYISVISPSRAAPGLLYVATGDSVFRSADGGDNWQAMPFSGGGTILTIESHPVATSTLYLGSSQGVFRSVDGGSNWTALGLREQAVTSIGISPSNPTQVYAGTYGKGLWSYTALPSLSIQPEGLNFLAEPGHLPLPIAMSVRDDSGGSSAWTIRTPSWVSVSPSSGVTLPVTVTASVNPGRLSAGSYEGVITVESAITTTLNSPRPVPVSLHFGPLSRQYLPAIAQGSPGW